ncbi:MAG: nitric-oxide reductase large subunit [Firmicutes bacterium]|nr:nitric-oxide reductase large subunit [Bacillota bacterium]
MGGSSLAPAKNLSQPGTTTGTGLDLWKHGLLLTVLIGFSVLLMGGFWIYQSKAPIPERIVAPSGTVLSTAANIKGGQAVYQKYGLMDYGSVLGHGAYLGEDFTAESLHRLTLYMRDFYARKLGQPFYTSLDSAAQAAVAQQVVNDLKANQYDPKAKNLVLTEAQAYAFSELRNYYREVFTKGEPDRGLNPSLISENHIPSQERAWVGQGDQINQISDFFFWTAWLSAVRRPGLDHTFTNNWPYDPAAGNTPTWASLWWSAASVALLILMMAFILYVYNRYRLQMEDAYTTLPHLDLNSGPVTLSQVKTAKYFLVVVLLFLAQSLLGGLLAHFYVQGNSFYGFDIGALLPFNVARGWHLQLAVFWIATAWLATGIFVAPAIGGGEPKWQGLLVDVLFVALVIVVGGSLLGEWLGARGQLGNLWWLLGNQGWEYLELGRIWQVLLAAGLAIWLYIVYRGIRGALASEKDAGGLVHLLLYSAIAIPLFYGAAFFINPGVNITYADYWRWWVIHIWVEGIFEVFAVVVVGYLMVSLGLVTYRSTLRALYFQIIILLGSGIIGTGHHYYWIGAPEFWIALGAVFSALEVIPLTLLILEAYGQYRVVEEGGHRFPYRASFWFLIATGFWNLVGAGVLGFLINLPVVNYFEHGSFLTATHGHAALAGVYGFFAVALLLYSLRNIVRPEAWNDRLLGISFWGLNLGLAGMVVLTLLPVGVIQLQEAYLKGFWAARSLTFYRQPLINGLLWLRFLPDTVFLVVGILPLVYFVARVVFRLRAVNR